MTQARVMITSAGTGHANSLVRSLQAEWNSAISIVGCHHDRFTLKKSTADRRCLIPPRSSPEYPAAIQRLVEQERIDLLIPTTDDDVRTIAACGYMLPCRLFLPDRATVDLCQDKYELTSLLRSYGVPAPVTYALSGLSDVDAVFGEFAAGTPLWCRVRTGTGSIGAIPVRTAEQARSWIQYWEQMRDVPAHCFTISEYLPGRDFACQSLWTNGQLVLIKTCERLSYFGGEGRPSGTSSTPALAKTVVEPAVVDVCVRAVRAADPRASGVFAVDLKQNADGVPCVTEINAGRFFMITNIFDLTGKHNMVATYVRLALDERVELRDEYDVTDEIYLVRDLDTAPGIFTADELFEGISQAAAAPRRPARSAHTLHRPSEGGHHER